MTQLPDYLTKREVAKRYRKSIQTINHWRQVGYGPAGVKVGTTVLYPRAAVEAFDRELQKAAPVT